MVLKLKTLKTRITDSKREDLLYLQVFSFFLQKNGAERRRDALQKNGVDLMRKAMEEQGEV